MRGELETEQRLQHIDPPTLQAITAFLPRSPELLNRGPWEPSPCWDMVLIPASSLQQIWTSCRRGYIIIWRPPSSCERHNSHSIQPVDSQDYPLISSTGCTCCLHWCISHLTAWPGRRSICNMVSSRIWTLVSDSISWDNNCYTNRIYIYL